MKVPADDDGGDAKTRDKDLFDELICAHRRKRRLEAKDHHAVEPEPGADFGFGPRRRQSKDDRPANEKVRRMRLEGQDGAGSGPLAGDGDGAFNDGLMAEMQAVEISDRVDRAFQPWRRPRRVRGEHEAVGHCVLPILGFRPTRPSVSRARQTALAS